MVREAQREVLATTARNVLDKPESILGDCWSIGRPNALMQIGHVANRNLHDTIGSHLE